MSKVRLGDVAIEVRETSKCPEGLPVVGLEHLLPSEITLTQWSDTSDNTFNKLFHKGQILFGRRRAYLKKAAVAPFDGVCSGDITVIAAKPERLLTELLPFIISNDAFFDYAMEKSAGSLSPRVKWAQLAEYEFDLPELEEQQKLANLLWAMERTRKAYQDLLIQADELVKSQFVEMFGELGTDNHGWGLTTLGKCCVLNPTRPRGISPDLQVSFVAMPSVTEKGEIDSSIVKPYSEASKGFTYFEERDVLFAKITPCMENGKGCVATGLTNGIGGGSTEFHVLRPISGVSNPYWLYCISIMPKFRKNARKVMTGTGGQLRVPISFIDSQPITLPPIDLQDQFEEFYHETDKSKLAIRQALESLEKSRSAIMTKVFG